MLRCKLFFAFMSLVQLLKLQTSTQYTLPKSSNYTIINNTHSIMGEHTRGYEKRLETAGGRSILYLLYSNCWKILSKEKFID